MSTNIAIFDQKMVVYERKFALQSLRTPLRLPQLYLGCFAEFKNGIGVEIGAKPSVLGGTEFIHDLPPRREAGPRTLFDIADVPSSFNVFPTVFCKPIVSCLNYLPGRGVYHDRLLAGSNRFD